MVCSHITHTVGVPAKFMEIQVHTLLQEPLALVAPPAAPLEPPACLSLAQHESVPPFSSSASKQRRPCSRRYATGYITGAVQIATGLCWGINNPYDLHTTAPHHRSTTAHVPQRQQACWYLARVRLAKPGNTKQVEH